PEQMVAASEAGLTLYCDEETKKRLEQLRDSGKYKDASVGAFLAAHLSQAKPGDYCALLAYIDETPDHDKMLQTLRTYMRDGLRVATTVGYGPRFLHSTGQLHKGGSDSGMFIQI